MAISFSEVMKRFSPADRADIEARAAILIAEEMSLQELRRARKLTQVRMAKKLKVGQESISRLEKRADLHLSTLRHYVEAMGGSLSLIASFPDRDPIELTGFATIEKKQPASVKDSRPAKRRSAARSRK